MMYPDEAPVMRATRPLISLSAGRDGMVAGYDRDADSILIHAGSVCRTRNREPVGILSV